MTYKIYYRRFGDTASWKPSKTYSSVKKVAKWIGVEWRAVRDNVEEELQRQPKKIIIDKACAHEYQVVMS